MLRTSPIVIVLLVALGCSPGASSNAHAGHGAATNEADASTPAPAGLLTRVEPELVCMINDQFMGKPQIPVEVEGTTYYGCCDMCKTKLTTDPASRSAIDPVSGNPVDKAHAVLGKTDAGAILYFESEQNLAAWTPREPAAEHAH
ncbi:hypothetical protein ACNOYE_36945 [Nannocystaceae bacterium ST9]